MNTKFLALAAAGVLLSATGAWSRSLTPAPTTSFDEEVERIAEWPKLKGGAKADVKKDIQRLRKAATPEMGDEAEDALIEVGAGVVPLLLPTLAKEEDKDAIERIDRVLHRVTGAEHTRVLAEFFDHKALEVRVWSLRRASGFPDAELRDDVLARLHKVVGTADAPARKEPDPKEAYALRLMATSTGSLEGLGGLFEATRDDWRERSDEILAALEGVHGEAATAAVIGFGSDQRKDNIAMLRMLWACGDESAVPAIKHYLDSEDASVRAATINALRCIVDGEEPLKNLPVFEGIERAKKWKARV